MNNKFLILEANGKVLKFLLASERLLIGRDQSCDVVLDHESVSRRHAAILHKHDAVYIENTSSVGHILKNNKPVEYAELAKGEKVMVGPYSLWWLPEVEAQQLVPEDSNLGAGDPSAEVTSVSQNSPTGAAPPDAEEQKEGEPFPALFLADANSSENAESSEEASPLLEENQSAEPAGEDFQLNLQSSSEPDQQLVQEQNTADDHPSPSQLAVISNEKTQVGTSTLHAIIKLIKGEDEPREIRLEEGVEWTFGRSPRCRVPIKNSKLSRQHFKIAREGSQFKLIDLGSANGTRVNGVSVSEVVLQPFDSIQAGPAELQFLVADSKMKGKALALGNSQIHQSQGFAASMSSPGVESTVFAAPMPYHAQPHAFQGVALEDLPKQPGASSSWSNASFRNASSSLNSSAPSPRKSWYASQPRSRQILIPLAVLSLFAALFSMNTGDTSPSSEVAEIPQQNGKSLDSGSERSPASATALPVNPVAEANGAEFAALSSEQQNKVRDLYAKAERAQSVGDWRVAHDSAKGVLGILKGYKKAKDILAEAQTFLNEAELGNIGDSLKDLNLQAETNMERVQLLLEAGKKALADARWEDAANAFGQAQVLDPTNAEADRGLAKAEAKDPNFEATVPTNVVQVQEQSLEEQIAAQEREKLQNIREQYRETKSLLNNGHFGRALSFLRTIEKNLKEKSQEYKTASRDPASVVPQELHNEVTELQNKIAEARETAMASLRARYQVDMADATELAANKQFVPAREKLDRILREEPEFSEAEDERKNLYRRILTEAKNFYQEGLVYESVGETRLARNGYNRAKELLTNVDDREAKEYLRRSASRLERLGGEDR